MRAHCSPKLLDELTRTVLYISPKIKLFVHGWPPAV